MINTIQALGGTFNPYVESLREVLEWDSNKRPRLGCVRDLNAVCPESWKYLGKGRGCQCPETYYGSCGRVSDFSGAEWTAAKKLLWSSKCLAEWPCRRELHVYINRSEQSD
jgi:CPW-WPC domain-containing protein